MAAIHSGRLTLDAVLRIEKRQPVTAHVNRTLLDILLDDDPQGSIFDHEDKKTWKAFRDRLRLKRLGSSSTSTSTSYDQRLDAESTSHSAESTQMGQDADSTRDSAETTQSGRGNAVWMRPGGTSHGVAREGMRSLEVALAEERALLAREAEVAGRAEEESRPVEGVVRVSLMDLLEETDGQMGVVGPGYAVPEDVEGADKEEGRNGGRVEQEHTTCCVCMVRQKGAAFIPCGHTFCRLCSKELLAKRGHCPLCNASILEILHIF